MNPIQLVLISGMGGAGRTTALHTLEDLGFYCVDNLPVVLLPKFIQLLGAHEEIKRIAIGFDVRDALFLPQAPDIIQEIKAMGLDPEILFLDAETRVLKRRYKETRRVHPLDKDGDLSGAIERERRMLQVIHPYIQTRIDTTSLTPHQLRDMLSTRYNSQSQAMRIAIVSFGYKYGILADADLVFDVRFLKNPYFVPELSKLTGLDKPVADYVFSDPDANSFVQKTSDLIQFLIPRYQKEGKHYLTIGIGCTGGQHRSIAIAEALYLRNKSETWTIHHREITRYRNE